MSIPGVNMVDRKDKPSHLQFVKGLAKLHGKDILPEVKMPVQRKLRKKGMKYHRWEDELRPLVVKELKKHSCTVWRIENSLKSNKGIPDLLVFHPLSGQWWVELKSGIGVLSKEQQNFRMLCNIAQVNYIVVRKLEDITTIFYQKDVGNG